MKSSLPGHLVACLNIFVIASAGSLDSTETSCGKSDREADLHLHSASLLQRLDPRVVAHAPTPSEFPASVANGPMGIGGTRVHRADPRHGSSGSGPVATSQGFHEILKTKEEVKVAAKAMANATDATKMAAGAASSAVRRPGVGLIELKRVKEAMKKAAKEQTLAAQKTKDAQKAQEGLQTQRQTERHLQRSSSFVESKIKVAKLLAEEAERLQTEALQANLVAAEAQNEASIAERAVTLGTEETIVCNWKMSSMCAPTFEYMGIRYDSCVSDDDDSEAWCSHHSLYEGAWSKCNIACEPKSKMPSMVQKSSMLSVAANSSRETLSFLETQKQDPASGASATLDETGYTAIAELCDSAEMTRFVRRLISAIGCRITNQNALVGFVPWYSGEADVQSYDKLNGELRCLCTRGQGPPWLEPIDPNNPPTGGLLKCTGRRCDQSK